jgi:hypothetical protein
MTIGEMLLPEFDSETASTREILECAPEDKFAWKLHDRSFARYSGHGQGIPYRTDWLGGVLLQ